MSTQIGHHLFKGKINNTRGYKRKGQPLSKTFEGTKGGASKTTFDTAPTMLVNRQNAQEFAGASLQSQAFYDLFKQKFSGEIPSIFGKLQKINVGIIKQGSGIPGERLYDINTYMENFQNFQVGMFPLNKGFTGTIEIIQGPGRNTVDTIFGPSVHLDIVWPKNATHYRLVTIFTNKSNSMYNNILKKYVNTASLTDFSFYYENRSSWIDKADTTDIYDPGYIGDNGIVIPTDVAMIVICGVEFAQYQNSQYVILKNNLCANIIDLF